ncbi:MAG: type IV pilus assembly protein PilM [Candidatus Sungbacteria bacterium]|nr:type IV pilus assembly protein PilM [Candidatus Sungbacteria bacterium]
MEYTRDVPEIPFFKKFSFPKLSLDILHKKPDKIIGLDVGVHSSKVVELEYTEGKAILKTYGELASAAYLKEKEGIGGGFLRFVESDIVELIKNILHESGVTAKHAVVSLPASSSFITNITLPRVQPSEIEQAIPYEARKYIPIPISEVILDWEVIEKANQETVEVVIVAVPYEVIEKFKRVAEAANIVPLALEVESFSMVRSLAGQDSTPLAIVSIGFQESILAIVDKTRLRTAHHFTRGSEELTRALEKGLSISHERAETVKHEAGLSERIEEREITSILAPFLETFFSEIERFISIYNRKAERKVQKVILTGGGSNLKGIVELAVSKFGIEVTKGNPFSRIVTPSFMQPMLREIGPSFSVAAGLALREIGNK